MKTSVEVIQERDEALSTAIGHLQKAVAAVESLPQDELSAALILDESKPVAAEAGLNILRLEQAISRLAVGTGKVVAGLLLAVGLSVSLNAQTFDPDPDLPDAEAIAEFRYELSLVGMMSGPVGWFCTASVPDIYGPLFVECEPDPLLLEAQERAREEWLRKMEERARTFLRRRR